jgi:outer membrane protein assembly factor BamB
MGAKINHVMEPILFSNLVIEGNEIDGIVAYDQKWGRKKWSKHISGGVTAPAKLFNGAVFFGAGDGNFYAIDATTGNTKWSFPIRSEGIGAPFVTSEAVYFLTGNNSAYALKTATGEQIWYYNRVDPANISVRGASEPTVVGDRVYAGFSDGFLVALDRVKGSLIWEKQLGASVRFRDVDTKPVFDGTNLYAASYDGQLFCVNASNGQTVWLNEDGGFTPVTLDGPNLYYSTSTRKVVALEKSSGKTLWSIDLINTVAGQPLVYRGLVIFGEWSGRLRAVDQSSGHDVTHFSTGRGVTSRPALNPETDKLYFMTVDANLYAVKLVLADKMARWEWEK